MDKSTTIHTPRIAIIFALLGMFASLQVFAQVPANSNGSPVQSLGSTNGAYAEAPYESDVAPLTATELETLTGPIALYPDDLLAIVLPASTYPLQIVQAARFLEAYANDSTLKPDDAWDDSVVALINYPEVITLMNDDIDWTWRLGEAVIAQQEELIAAVESFRDRAYAAGNLKTDKYQSVSVQNDIIEIVPIEKDVIYVPYYEPERVVVRQARPVYNYYDRPYPVYYYPYPAGHAFSSGYFWGVTTAFRIGWATDRLRVQHASYLGHPYYGYNYDGDHYRRPSISIYNTMYVNNARRHSSQRYRRGDYWRPRRHSGARQSDYNVHSRQYRNDTQRVHNSGSSRSTTRSRNNGATHNSSRLTASSFRPRTQRQSNRDDSYRSRQQPRTQLMARNDSSRAQSRQRSQHDVRSNSSRSQTQQRPPRRARNEPSRPQKQAVTQRSSGHRSDNESQQRPPRRSQNTPRRSQKKAVAQRSSGHRSDNSQRSAERSEPKRSSNRSSKQSSNRSSNRSSNSSSKRSSNRRKRSGR